MVAGVNTGKRNTTHRKYPALHFVSMQGSDFFHKPNSEVKHWFSGDRVWQPPVPLSPVAQRTTDQANIVGDATVAGANELSQQTVEGMENAAVNSGLVNQVSHILSFHIVKMMANPSPLRGTVGWTVGGGWNRDSYNRLEISLAIPGEETSTGPSFNSLILVSKTQIFPSWLVVLMFVCISLILVSLL